MGLLQQEVPNQAMLCCAEMIKKARHSGNTQEDVHDDGNTH